MNNKEFNAHLINLLKGVSLSKKQKEEVIALLTSLLPDEESPVSLMSNAITEIPSIEKLNENDDIVIVISTLNSVIDVLKNNNLIK